jgi:hypothetical protein
MRLFGTMLVTGTLAALPLAAQAQKAPAPEQKPAPASAPAPKAPPSPMEAQMRLMKAQQEALAKPEVKKELDAIEGLMQKKMVEADPASKPKIARLEVLKTQLEALSKAQPPDPAKAQPLVQEAQQIASELGPVQKKVMEQPDVLKRMEAFDKQLMGEMTKIDPDVLMLIAMLQGGRGQGGGGHAGHGH